MKIRTGVPGKLFSMVLLALVLALLATLVLWQRQDRLRDDVVQLGRQAIQSAADASLRQRSESEVAQLADALANPLYYLDMDAIDRHSRAALQQAGVGYVLVFDMHGRVIHDGTGDIAAYSRRMDDPLAFEALSATGLHTQRSQRYLDVSAPIVVAGERVGGVRIGYDLAVAQQPGEQARIGFTQDVQARARQQSWWFAGFAFVLVVLAGLLLWWAWKTLLAPLRRLARAARECDDGTLVASIPQSGRDDEIGELERRFARMTDSMARHERELRRVAYIDALTGLDNRPAFREILDQRLLQLGGASGQLALLLADIDDFKRVNDSLGHDAGDEILLQFANRIRETVERFAGSDAVLARLGGDEFAVLLESGAQYGNDIRVSANRLADALLAEFNHPVVVQERQVFLSASIGMTLFPEDAGDTSTLMKKGDIAVYQAKVAGKNCHRFYSRAMDQAVERRVRLELELRGAWAREELYLAYQPVYRLADGQMVGAEALLRWRHPELGMVAPSVFIDIAEQSGLIEVIGPQVLRMACADAVRWQSEYRNARSMFVAVNISARQLRSGDLPEVVAECLADTGLASSSLHLELTETAVLDDEINASTLLGRLRSNGVKVWLDDFGTGFSGLSHLRRVPVDGVKIDRSFTADVLRDPDDLALTTAIIAMAHSLGITVVAEGVEKEGQFLILRERGCDLAQGFWLGHPVNAQEFANLLT